MLPPAPARSALHHWRADFPCPDRDQSLKQGYFETASPSLRFVKRLTYRVRYEIQNRLHSEMGLFRNYKVGEEIALDIGNLPWRLTTGQVLELAGYKRHTLRRRIKAGTFPAPIDRAAGNLFDRIAVLRALQSGPILTSDRPSNSQWGVNKEALRDTMRAVQAQHRKRK